MSGTTANPLPVGDVMARFLCDPGVDGRDIPADEDERAAGYRIALARRRMPELASTRLVDLNVLHDDEALKLFTRVVGRSGPWPGCEAGWPGFRALREAYLGPEDRHGVCLGCVEGHRLLHF